MYLKREVEIRQPLARVFPYVLHFSNLFEWDDNVTEGTRVDLGQVKVGSRFLFQYALMGRTQTLEYILRDLKENKKLYFECKADNFSAIDEISFMGVRGNTHVTYEATIALQGKIAERLFRPIMERVADKVVKRLKIVLEADQDAHISGRSHKPLTIVNLPYRFTAPGWNSRRKKFYATESVRKKILVTGPTSGLGLSATKSLAGNGCDLVLVARNQARLDQLTGELRERGFCGDLDTYICDMQDIKQVIETCSKIVGDGHQLDAVINNAGALFNEERAINGIERTTVVDLIAPWIFSTHLSKQLVERSGCIVNVSSGGMYSVPLNIGRLKKPRHPFSGAKAYAFAKRAMTVFSSGLNAELEAEGVRVHCMHPGWADTPGVLNSLPGFHALTKRFLRTPFQGADTIVWLAMMNPTNGGELWLDREVQPLHIVPSTQTTREEYRELKEFLDSTLTV